MIDATKLAEVVDTYINDHEGFFVVKTDVHPGNKLTVIIDHDHDNIVIDTCVELSKYIESHFDRDIEDYELEVSSAGLTTPLSSPRQYKKYIGKELEVKLKSGTKEIGLLKEVNDDGIIIEVERLVKPEGAKRKKPVQEDLSISYSDIKQAVYLIRF